eukprot:TRINITY_DN30928_c0_g1_i1.p1 TRINITY_DN30928_c0_g1~~TRINITY_DN30928_c0_g1_i1.p1  ORF type:complete len:126 (+),score=4.72 TRINITY_DN30928_c0_g1_i1:320-697(+)
MLSRSFPGPDQLVAKTYQTHISVIAPVFTELFNSLSPSSLVPKFVESFTTLVPKKKEPFLPLTIRPISLCNTDYKILSQVLAAQMLSTLPDILSKQQIGYMSKKRMHDNVILPNYLLQVHSRTLR